MMKGLLIILLIAAAADVLGQTRFDVRKDTVKVVNAELLIDNKTKDTPGFLYNTANGRTIFKELELQSIGPQGIVIIGQDTLNILKPSKYIDGLFREGDSLFYTIGGARRSFFSPLGGSAEFIQNQSVTKQQGTFKLSGKAEVVDTTTLSGVLNFAGRYTQISGSYYPRDLIVLQDTTSVEKLDISILSVSGNSLLMGTTRKPVGITDRKNTVVGIHAMDSCMEFGNNTVLGTYAAVAVKQLSSSVLAGTRSASSIGDSVENSVVLGVEALSTAPAYAIQKISANGQVVIGYGGALGQQVAPKDDNILIGRLANANARLGKDNIFIGRYINFNSPVAVNNAILIGNSVGSLLDSVCVLGGSTVNLVLGFNNTQIGGVPYGLTSQTGEKVQVKGDVYLTGTTKTPLFKTTPASDSLFVADANGRLFMKRMSALLKAGNPVAATGSNYTVTDKDINIFINTISSVNTTIYLPNPALHEGRVLTIKRMKNTTYTMSVNATYPVWVTEPTIASQTLLTATKYELIAHNGKWWVW